MYYFLSIILLVIQLAAKGQTISGIVTDNKGNVLPYASVEIKGTNKGSVTNAKGYYSISVNQGKHIVVCQYVGFERSVKEVTVKEGNVTVDFTLNVQVYKNEVASVRASKENYAYTIIRNAIKKRDYYNKQVNSFTSDLYTKDILKLRSIPKAFMGKQIKEDDKKDMGVDSAGRGMLYLSESINKLYVEQPNKFKMEVKSSRVSGSNSFALSIPQFINFYENNVQVLGRNLSPRGYISPIANSALHYYKFKYLGVFEEDGKDVYTVKVMPKRNNEPLFEGTINIYNESWNIHSVAVELNKQRQLQLLDTLKIKQLHTTIGTVERVKDQVLYLAIKQFGFDVVGNFVNVFSNYAINPVIDKKVFNNTIIKYDTAVRKTVQYWDSIRPIALEQEEIKDYKIKDSIFEKNKDSIRTQFNMDTLRKKQKPIKLNEVLLTGVNRTHYYPKNLFTWGVQPLLQTTEYNTAEGIAIGASGYLQRYYKKIKRSIRLMPELRYSLARDKFTGNAYVTIGTKVNKTNLNKKGGAITIGGGTLIKQINNQNPITPLFNSFTTYFQGLNFLKNYEADFGEVVYRKKWEEGVRLKAGALYEARTPMVNLTNKTRRDANKYKLQPNDSSDNRYIGFASHQAFIVQMEVSYQPGQRFIEFPRYKMSIGSKYPTFKLNYTKGIPLANAVANFDKWQLSVFDDMNLKLKGTLKYNLAVGGFLNTKKLFIQDYQHFNGNRFIAAAEYMNSFQLADYYANSTAATLYGKAHIEHHFNGLLTNKIPFFNKLNWHLVAGGNAFYVNKTSNYIEAFVGLENIFKIFRVDVVVAYNNNTQTTTGIRIGAGGLLGNGFANANRTTNADQKGFW